MLLHSWRAIRNMSQVRGLQRIFVIKFSSYIPLGTRTLKQKGYIPLGTRTLEQKGGPLHP